MTKSTGERSQVSHTTAAGHHNHRTVVRCSSGPTPIQSAVLKIGILGPKRSIVCRGTADPDGIGTATSAASSTASGFPALCYDQYCMQAYTLPVFPGMRAEEERQWWSVPRGRRF
jgi:hypothetical protein